MSWKGDDLLFAIGRGRRLACGVGVVRGLMMKMMRLERRRPLPWLIGVLLRSEVEEEKLSSQRRTKAMRRGRRRRRRRYALTLWERAMLLVKVAAGCCGKTLPTVRDYYHCWPLKRREGIEQARAQSSSDTLTWRASSPSSACVADVAAKPLV